MIEVSLEFFATVFVMIGMVFFVFLWLFYDRRDRIYYDRQRLKHVHHCAKCGHLYTSRFSTGTAPCPNCELPNPPLHF